MLAPPQPEEGALSTPLAGAASPLRLFQVTKNPKTVALEVTQGDQSNQGVRPRMTPPLGWFNEAPLEGFSVGGSRSQGLPLMAQAQQAAQGQVVLLGCSGWRHQKCRG